MDIDEFQRYALKSVALPKDDAGALPHRLLGIVGEAGILANQVKRIVRDKNGKPTQQDIALIEEKLGDILYYSAVTAEYFDLKMSSILEKNMKKSDEFRALRD